MTRYEQRLQHDLDDIHARLAKVAARVEKAIEDALGTVLSGDEDLAYRTILNDEWINREVREIDRLCHKFVAVHLPSAGPLRRMSSVIRTNIQLERLGDYAVTICREAVQLTRPPEGAIARELEMTAIDARRTMRQAIAAFVGENGEVARATMHLADQVEHTMDSIYDALLGAESTEELRDRVALFVVFNMLKRVWDQAKNICEETVFAVYGEQKSSRVHNVLFIDRDNCCTSQMAETIARKAHGERARFHSAGREPVAAPDPRMVAFMEAHGFDMSANEPSALADELAHLDRYFVIVGLDGPVKSCVPRIPFHTSALTWDVASVDAQAGEEDAARQLESIYRDLAVRIDDLMQVLSGSGEAWMATTTGGGGPLRP